MSYQKCPACDGYGNRPHRTKPNKRAKCRACKGGGIVGAPDFVPVPMPAPQPLVPAIGAPIPYVPFDPSRIIGTGTGRPWDAPPDPFNPLGGHGGFCACPQCCPPITCSTATTTTATPPTWLGGGRIQ